MQLSDEAQRVADVAAAMLGAVVQESKVDVKDSTHKTAARHALGKIKDRDGVFVFLVRAMVDNNNSFFCLLLEITSTLAIN